MLSSPRHRPALSCTLEPESGYLRLPRCPRCKGVEKNKVLGLGWSNSTATLTTRHPRTHRRKSSVPLRLYPRRVPVVDQADRPRLGFPSHLPSELGGGGEPRAQPRPASAANSPGAAHGAQLSPARPAPARPLLRHHTRPSRRRRPPPAATNAGARTPHVSPGTPRRKVAKFKAGPRSEP